MLLVHLQPAQTFRIFAYNRKRKRFLVESRPDNINNENLHSSSAVGYYQRKLTARVRHFRIMFS